MRTFFAAAIVSGLVAGSAIAADEPTTLEPSSGWVLSRGEDSCALNRRFGEEGEEVSLEFRKFNELDEMQVIVASPDFVRRERSFEFQFVPIDAEPIEDAGKYKIRINGESAGRLFNYGFAGGEGYDAAYREFILTTPVLEQDQRDLLIEVLDMDSRDNRHQKLVLSDEYQAAMRRVSRAFRQSETYRQYIDARERDVTGLFLDSAFRTEIFLHTGELHSPMEDMRRCIDELRAQWGIDVDAHRTLMRGVEPYDYNRLVQEMIKDYPREGLRRGLPAMLRVRLDVSAAGEPTGCHMQSGINHPDFEKTACENMMRFARFHPALDAEGHPLASYFQIAVAYQLR